MTAKSLQSLGITELSVDLGLPTLANTIFKDLGITDTGEKNTLRAALNQKDAARISAFGGKAADIFGVLLSAVGPIDSSLEKIKNLEFSTEAEQELNHLTSVVECIKKKAPEICLTVDPVEIRGYEYHTCLTFTFFSKGVRGELGRGGRYISNYNDGSDVGELATGVTLFVDTLLNSLPKLEKHRKIFIPLGSDNDVVDKYSSEGWITIAELSPTDNQSAEALRLGCTHILRNNKIKEI